MTDYEQGDRVELRIPAYIMEIYPDGDALVDCDGSEILVASDEIIGEW